MPTLPTRPLHLAAVDLGAASGRVMLGRLTPSGQGPPALTVTEAYRFANRPVRLGATLHWDVLALYQGVLDGLRAAGERAGGHLDGVGVDSWAVDYGLLDATGALLGNPVHHRDPRTEGVPQQVERLVPAADLYAATGLQYLPFNTLYQLFAERGGPRLAAARHLLLIPDLITYWLTGEVGTELTNASTTQLIDPGRRDWARPVAEALGVDLGLFAPLRRPSDPAGTLRTEVLAEVGLAGPVPVTAVGSHDTASAVVGVPASGPRFGYVSAGTWSLAGVELDAPVRTEESRRANFTNELGVDGTVRYLRNIMGLWLLQECQRHWRKAGRPADLEGLLARAARVPALRSVVDAGDPRFLAPGGMPERIAEECRRTDQPVPGDEGETVRCVLDSLALAHRRALWDAQRLTGRPIDTVHVVGGGSRNALLCQLTADACGLPVVAGPAEATAWGNLLVQARAAGGVTGTLDDLRGLLRGHRPWRRYDPSGDRAGWDRAASRLASQAADRVGP